MKRTAVIGPGRVGTALGMALTHAGYEVVAVAGRTAPALERFVERVPTAAVRDLATTGQPPIRFIPTNAELAVLEQRHPGQYRPFLLQKGAYPGVTEEVQGVGVANVLIVSSKAKDATIDAVLDERREGDEGAPDRDAAQRLLDRNARSLARVTDPRQRRARAYALLARNGFDPDVCREVAAQVVVDLDDSEAASESR